MPAKHKTTSAANQLAPHIEEIARAIRKKVDGKREGWGTANFTVRRSVSRLSRIAGTRRLTSHSATFRRAMVELQDKELPRASQRREVNDTVTTIARHLGLADSTPKPAPKKKLPPPKRIKGVNRVRVSGDWLEEHGIERDDRVLIAMTGDVRPGELGYFKVLKQYDSGAVGDHHSALFFLTKRDKACERHGEAAEGVCLRTFADRCGGYHVGEEGQGVTHSPCPTVTYTTSAVFYGRVVGVERDRRPVETTLQIRPYDEREQTAAATDWNPRGKGRGKKKQEAPARTMRPRGGAPLYVLIVKDDLLHNVGLVDGESVPVLAAPDLKEGDAGAIEKLGCEGVWAGRVVAVDADSITLRDEEGDHTFARAEIASVGRLDLSNVTKDDPLSKEDRARVNKFRKKLENLDDSDSTLSVTWAYEIEKEIFDLKHPKDVDDWSAWEE